VDNVLAFLHVLSAFWYVAGLVAVQISLVRAWQNAELEVRVQSLEEASHYQGVLLVPGAIAAGTATGSPRKLVTTTLSVDFAGNARPGDWIEARVDVMRPGKRVAFVNCFVYHGADRIARASATFQILRPEE